MKTKLSSRMTKQRQVVLEELRKMSSHPTVDELYRRVLHRLKAISIFTVYRNLEVSSEGGLIQKMDTPGTQRRFDGNTANHYHMRCAACGRVEDVDFEPVPALEWAMQRRSNYKVLSHRLEFIGLCPACLATNRDVVDAQAQLSALTAGPALLRTHRASEPRRAMSQTRRGPGRRRGDRIRSIRDESDGKL